MAVVCPTVTALDAHTYRAQVERVSNFAPRIHIDLADNVFAPKLIDPEHIWWPNYIRADIHLMYKDPLEVLEKIAAMNPKLVIVHAESNGDFNEIHKILSDKGIKVGIALLAQTKVEVIASSIHLIDHVLIFSGTLGHFGGQADLRLLSKITELRKLKPELEVAWDGGINELNALSLVDGGIDVLDVGGYIQRSDDPVDAYAKLNLLLLDGQNSNGQ